MVRGSWLGKEKEKTETKTIQKISSSDSNAVQKAKHLSLAIAAFIIVLTVFAGMRISNGNRYPYGTPINSTGKHKKHKDLKSFIKRKCLLALDSKIYF